VVTASHANADAYDARPVDFDETLHALLGLMGTVVSVHVRHPGSRAAPALMLVTGPLTAAPEVVEQLGGSSEVFFCRIGNGPMLSGFFVDRERFEDAAWDEDEDTPTLVIELNGGTALVVREEKTDLAV
jgi:hypothetical protein